jgi:hypothetical protein
VDSRVHYNNIQTGIVAQIFNIVLEAQFNLSFSIDGENKEEKFHYEILKRLQNLDICVARYSVATYFWRDNFFGFAGILGVPLWKGDVTWVVLLEM